MSFLKEVKKGPSMAGLRMIIAGQEKMGKTSFCASAPDVLLVPLETGVIRSDCARLDQLRTYEEVDALVDEIVAACQSGEFPYKTVALDSASGLERLIHEHTIALDPVGKNGKLNTMETAHGGFGKAYAVANDLFEDILKRLSDVADFGGVNVIFTCHVYSTKNPDPTVGVYDSWDLLLHTPKNGKSYGKRDLAAQWADVIGFIYEPMMLQESDDKKLTRGVSKGRSMGLSRTPAYIAGNKLGIEGEIKLPDAKGGWTSFSDALVKALGN